MESEAEYHARRAKQERDFAARAPDCISRSEHEELAELHEHAVVEGRKLHIVQDE